MDKLDTYVTSVTKDIKSNLNELEEKIEKVNLSVDQTKIEPTAQKGDNEF